MKKIALIALFFSALTLHAQSPTFRFGLTATPVFDWLRIEGDSYENGGTKFGFQYGLLFDQTIGNVERYAFSSGILINYVNASYSYATGVSLDSTSEIDLRVQYIEIPLTMRLRTNEVNYLTYYGQFGLTPGFRIKARADYFEEGTALDEDLNFTEENISGATYNLMNISLTLGAGAEYALTENTSIMGGIFWQNGFANVIDDDVEDNNAYLKQIGVRVGVLF